MLLALYLRERSHYRDYGSGSSSYGTSLFGHPLLLNVPRSSCSRDDLYNLFLQRLARYVRPPDPSRSWKRKRRKTTMKRSCTRLRLMASVMMRSRRMQREPVPPRRSPAAVTDQPTANQTTPLRLSPAPPPTTRSPHWTRATPPPPPPITALPTRPSSAAPMATALIQLPTALTAITFTAATPPPTRPPTPNPQQSRRRSSPVRPQKKKRKKTSRKRRVLPACRPMSNRLRGGRVARGRNVCSPSRRSTPTGRPREEREREGAPCPSALSRMWPSTGTPR